MRKPVMALLLTLILAGCAINNVSTDYDPNTLLVGMARYAWAPTKESAPFPSLDLQRLRVAVDQTLASKAMQPVAPADAELWVQTGMEFREVRDVSTMEMGSAFDHPLLIRGDAIVHVHQYTEAVIFVQFISPRDARVVWRGQLTRPWRENITPAKREQILRQAVTQIVAGFPPTPGQ